MFTISKWVQEFALAAQGVDAEKRADVLREGGVPESLKAELSEAQQRQVRAFNMLPGAMKTQGSNVGPALAESNFMYWFGKAIETKFHEAYRAGIAKSRVKANVRGKVVERSEERFFLPGRKNPVVLKRGSAALFLLERLRDEAHRFAITYHRKLRSKAQLISSLSDIPGVGAKRQKALLKYFGSLKKIRLANQDELSSMPGLPRQVAEAIYQHYHK